VSLLISNQTIDMQMHTRLVPACLQDSGAVVVGVTLAVVVVAKVAAAVGAAQSEI
jgi:hypothetical protein